MASDSSVLDPFLIPGPFDAADYLNAALNPKLNLSDLSSQTQNLLSLLNAQTSRLTPVLTQLTDDILRSGARLAYEVHLLQGEAIGLSDALSERLQDDIALFMPETTQPQDDSSTPPPPGEPPYITHLRTLTHVKARLESVIKVFGEAMHWSLPPSEISSSLSSFITVSDSESHSREEKGREFAETLRSEIADLIVHADNRAEGHEAALARVGALRELAEVWRGTAEEKARVRFVEGLVSLADGKLRELEREDGSRFRTADSKKVGGAPAKTGQGSEKNGSMGFLDNLHRMRSNISFE
ncbi:hypothetical protein EG328_007872 [Venturia inaequalis]|uniref:Uncharacterized protein n=1 Tax=Venturia inaequalis TaxID=5025 RepID=A0A8H3VCA0_VENIN|nr:hypothetical protein EG328_007872 [Venturia inaequalis]RDI89278.1 hypothetical protein Vi05172_g591 [Venturia inaequalis]